MVNRQQMPQNWGMPRNQAGQYPYPMYQPRRNMQMYPTYPSTQMRRGGFTRQRGQMGSYGQTNSRAGGGLLAKLFGKTTPQMPQMGGGGFLGMAPSATRAAATGGAASGGSLLQTLTNPTAISGFLNNTQQVLNAFQQITPLVSQYGPIVKNLPAMWRLYRGLKDATATNDEENEESTIEIEESASLSEVEEIIEYESDDESDDESGATNDISTSHQVNTRSYSHKHRTRKHSDEHDNWDESEEAEVSKGLKNKDVLQERRSFPRMYI
ncbi:VrrA/YqfQ family protein [Bacillus marasmi]|uniref:VrrA/YqfQ family protein n=1 Tax=Bacillus marasmi TaxID=1926279 RepID=UPI0011CAFA63|nr:VrrA/YqfQ family protein [Bacillus marasmi]